jgi:hypothetical protein
MIMFTVYGYSVTSSDDYFVRGVQEAIESFSRAALPASELDHILQPPGSDRLSLPRRFRSEPNSLAQIRTGMDSRCRMEAYN